MPFDLVLKKTGLNENVVRPWPHRAMALLHVYVHVYMQQHILNGISILQVFIALAT